MPTFARASATSSGRGKAPVPAHEPPAPDQRGNGNIERAAALLAQFLGLLQQREQARRDPHGLLRGAGVEVGDFAAGPEQAELGFQLFDLPQRLFARRPQRRGILPMQHDLESGRHRMAGNGDGGHGGGME